jgi:hypothetical protein
LFSLAFFSSRNICSKQEKRKADKESSAKVETKGADKKNQSRIKSY